MSIIFGIWRTDGAPVEEAYLAKFAQATERYAPDGTFVRFQGDLGMGFQPYHTYERSNLEVQPVVDARGNMLTFDGRLDNHEELEGLLDLPPRITPDSQIVLSAFDRWGEQCFSRLTGDWALALWWHENRTLFLARDHAGTRTLYFTREQGMARWSTYLENLVESCQPVLDEDYIACYLASRPFRDLTPYRGIRSVLPSHYIALCNDAITIKAHWNWMSKNELRYKHPTDYDEHFRSLFQQAVERRDGIHAPVIAELSGGMDSSAIVCMSDHSRKLRGSDRLIETLSYYCASEPNWDEQPYFSLVEAKRNKIGTHVDVSPPDPVFSLPRQRPKFLFPTNPGTALERERRLTTALGDRHFRAVLSGTGGDEVLGGVPTLLPELAGYLVSGQFTVLFQRALQSCLPDRTPLLHRLAEVGTFTYFLYRRARLKRPDGPAWLSPWTLSRVHTRQEEDVTGISRLGYSPNSICCGLTWWSLVETLPHLTPMCLCRYEYRYPYLDRDLVEYLFQIPREELVQPGRRRTLMRRSLQHIVPSEILERRRKAFVVRGPLRVLQQEQAQIATLLNAGWLQKNGYIDRSAICQALERIVSGAHPEGWMSVAKAATFELWLQTSGMDAPVPRAAQPPSIFRKGIDQPTMPRCSFLRPKVAKAFVLRSTSAQEMRQ